AASSCSALHHERAASAAISRGPHPARASGASGPRRIGAELADLTIAVRRSLHPPPLGGTAGYFTSPVGGMTGRVSSPMLRPTEAKPRRKPQPARATPPTGGRKPQPSLGEKRPVLRRGVSRFRGDEPGSD